MKRTVFCFLALLLTLSAAAQSVLSLGARGGVNIPFPQSEHPVRTDLGGVGAIDFGYTAYWDTHHGDWGIHTGVSVGYATGGCLVELDPTHATNYDYLSNEMAYTTSGHVTASLQQVYTEIPLMAAVRYYEFTAQLGMKAQCAVWSQTMQDLQDAYIDAYYVPYDVHVTNELITGLVSPDNVQRPYAGGAPLFNLLVAARVGYEIETGPLGRFGMALYVDYNVWNMRTHTDRKQPFIEVAPITDAQNPVPAVTVNNAFTTAVSGINPLQVGVAFYYAFELR